MENKKRKTVIVLFWIYAALMVWLMFLQRIPTIIGNGSFENYGEQLMCRLKIVPFETIGEFVRSLSRAWTTHAFVNLVGNVLMFVPLGLGLSVVSKKARSFLGCILCAFLVILSAETIQLFTLLGYFDVDDLILNLIGVAMGYWLQVLFCSRSK